MGQKINSTGLRLKKKINWKYNFSVYNFSNYSQTLLDVNQTENAVSSSLKNIKFFQNDLLILKSSKKTSLYCKLLNYKKATNNLNVHTNSNRTVCVNDLMDNSKQFLFSSKKIQLTTSDVYFNKNNINFTNYIKNKVNIISPLIVVSYITNYLNKDIKKKLSLSNQNIQVIIARFLDILLRYNKSGIVGIKIICSGKWKKTRSGRKQSFVIQRGLLQKSSMSNNIFFDYDAQKTKFGMFGIKVWIALKNNKR